MESQGGGPGDSIALSSPAIAHLLEPRSACSLRRNTPLLLPTTHRPETRIDRSLGWPGTEQAQRKRKVSFSPLGQPHAQSRERERMLISESWKSCSGNWKNIYTCVCVSVCVRQCVCVCARARAYSAYRAQLQGNLAAALTNNFESRQGGGGERFSAWVRAVGWPSTLFWGCWPSPESRECLGVPSQGSGSFERIKRKVFFTRTRGGPHLPPVACRELLQQGLPLGRRRLQSGVPPARTLSSLPIPAGLSHLWWHSPPRGG
ncbi:PREDICTED: uncharacterized protein LOC108535738 [Rhinopithecus bieti]|uniref:uncharacterized protein LOC108535738 n=1 Tax=Rhinopithecus bieti TaxID=61621 RepID=UPI00083C6D69|nr:PREDICTED: uncharacterized protein LOC108535738 [Rhinopithecus bieti]